MNLLISLYDHSGNASRPYKENGWDVLQIDIKNGIDILKWQYRLIDPEVFQKIGMIIMQPCTCYAACGNRHKKSRSKKEYNYAQLLVKTSRKVIDYFNPFFWQLENPITDIHSKNSWIGQRPKFVFDPCDFAGYDPNPVDSRYRKKTWLFGKFNDPVKHRLEPLSKEFPGFENLGGGQKEQKN